MGDNVIILFESHKIPKNISYEQFESFNKILIIFKNKNDIYKKLNLDNYKYFELYGEYITLTMLGCCPAPSINKD